MTDAQKAQMYDALLHGFPTNTDCEEILKEDMKVLEPLIDVWIAEARDYYSSWARHDTSCNLFTEGCSCGLGDAILTARLER